MSEKSEMVLMKVCVRSARCLLSSVGASLKTLGGMGGSISTRRLYLSRKREGFILEEEGVAVRGAFYIERRQSLRESEKSELRV